MIRTETVKQPPAAAAKGVRHTALDCLAAVAAHHGITTTADRLRHDYALPAGEPRTAMLVRMARELGLKARAGRLNWDELMGLGSAYPVIARLANGNAVIIIGPEQDGSGRLGVVDPLAGLKAVLWLAREQFVPQWHGEIIFLKRDFTLTDEAQPFGLRWFIPELLRQRAAFRDVAVTVITLHFIGLLVPIFFQLIIDKVLVHQTESTLWVLSLGVTVAVVFEAVFNYVRRMILLAATNKVDIRLTTRTFSHLMALPIQYFENTSAGVTIKHLQQVEKIRAFLTGRLFQTALDSTSLLIFVPFLFLYSFKLTLLVLAFALVISLFVVALLGPFRRRLTQLYSAEAERQAMLVEAIQGMRTVKAAAIEPVLRRHWDQRTARAMEMHYRVGRISIGATAVTGLLEKLQTIAVIVLGAAMVFTSELTVGALVAFQMLAGRVVGPLVQIVGLIQDYQETALSVNMLGKVMNRPPERHGAGIRPPLSGRLDFDAVTFRYRPDSPPALDRVSLTVPAGSVLGVVGKSGSGKSTLTRLVQGLYPVQEGVVRVDGIDIREIDLAHLRRAIGVVLQDNFLFRGTIRDNIAITRPDAGYDEVIAAARLAGADEFVERMPQGYDTVIEENAANLSGGQRQRLAIARALLPQPPILILDEATSALDPDSEAIFMDNLAGIAAGRTVIVVSHRLSTLVGCDAIVVLEQGRVADQGRHDVLLARCAPYRHLWDRQNRLKG